MSAGAAGAIYITTPGVLSEYRRGQAREARTRRICNIRLGQDAEYVCVLEPGHNGPCDLRRVWWLEQASIKDAIDGLFADKSAAVQAIGDMTTTSENRTLEATHVRSVVDDLANKRRDLADARIFLRQTESEMADIKRMAIARLLDAAGGEIPGKSQADRERVIEDYLRVQPAYETAKVGVEQARATVEKLAVEVEVLADYFSLARMEARNALADALRQTGTHLDDL